MSLKDTFRRLLEWEFGPDGILSLQVVAFGDFAHGRNSEMLRKLFICRDMEGWDNGDPPYQIFDARDEEQKHNWIALVRPHPAFPLNLS